MLLHRVVVICSLLKLSFREAAEKEAAREQYWKLHLEGKTEQAKADLARLALIRKQREEAANARKAKAEGW